MLKILNDRGFGLIQTFAALLITSVAVAGIFISANYARNRAIENYHYRKALLYANARIDLIKFYAFYNHGIVNLNNIPGLYNEVVIDEEGNGITAQVSVHKNTYSDIEVAPYALYDAVTVTLTWNEHLMYLLNIGQTTQRTVTLREDHFKRNDQ